MSKAAELAALIGSQSALSNRNLIINGAASVNQRGDSTGVTATGYHGPDRFQLLYTDAGTWSISQSSTAPEGFANSYKLDCTTAKSSLASDSRLFVQTKFEGQDLQHLKKGTSNAVSTTLSFFVRSNKTGTYQVNLEDNDNTRIIGATYTISSANTFEHKTITFAGDTSGALTDDNGDSLSIMWALVAGTDNSSGAVPTAWEAKSNTDRGAGLNVNLADSTDNEWYITGVQLEVGEQATPFEHRSFGDELARCQRYFERFKRSYSEMGQSSSADATLWAGCSRSGNSGNNQGVMRYTRKRNNPTLSVSSATHINGIFPISPFNTTLSGFDISGNAGIDSAFINATNNASSAPGSDCASFVYIPNDSGYLDVDAEL